MSEQIISPDGVFIQTQTFPVRSQTRRSNTSYLIGGGSIAGSVSSQVRELLLELMVRAVAEAVDHGGGQQHAHDAEDGHHGEDEELGDLGLAVLGGDLVDLAPLWVHRSRERQKEVKSVLLLLLLPEASGSVCRRSGQSVGLSQAR